MVRRNRRVRSIFNKAALHLVLSITGFFMLVPFFWMLSTSLKEPDAVFIYPPEWIPNPVVWSNYRRAWTILPFGQAYINSIVIAVTVTIGTLVSCSLAAYAFARLEFKGKNVLFYSLLATMMIPGQVTLIPMYVLFSRIGWIDTHYPLVIPPILSNAFGVFLLRQFFLTIPKDLEDAARIDGCNPAYVYWLIMLPLAKPALVTLGIFTFLGTWNSFLPPLIYLNTTEKFTVPLLLRSFQGLYSADWTLMMAASSIAILPVMIAYLFGQRYFIEGITLTGLKG
jgi:multiple sugar transport system permease protein